MNIHPTPQYTLQKNINYKKLGSRQNQSSSMSFAGRKEIVAGVTKDLMLADEVAPFARRILHQDAFSPESESYKIIKAIDKTKREILHIKDEKSREIFAKLYNRVINETTNIENISNGLSFLIRKVDLLDSKETKNFLFKDMNSFLGLRKKYFKKEFQSQMRFVEMYVDAANIMNEKYYNINSKPRDFYKWLNDGNSWFADAIDGVSKEKHNFRNGYASNADEKLDFVKYKELISLTKEFKVPKIYTNDLSLEAFRHFAKRYSSVHYNAVANLYENEYLPKLSPELANKFKAIHDEYGTMVITSDPKTTLADAKFVEEELRLWREAGDIRAILPTVINVDYLDKGLKQTNSLGMAYPFLKMIDISTLLAEKEEKPLGNIRVLRHEMTHLNDRSFRLMNDLEKLVDLLKWKFFKKLHGNKCEQELMVANISDNNIQYAMKNKHELAAVTLESNVKDLSISYINRLVNWFNLEAWMFDVRPNEYIENASKDLLKIHRSNKSN